MDHDSVDQENIKSDLECDTFDSSEEENIDRYLEKLGHHSLYESFVDSDSSEEGSMDSEDDSYTSHTYIEKKNSRDSIYDSTVNDSKSSPASLAHFPIGATCEPSVRLNECPSKAHKNFETEEKFVSESISHSSNETNSIIYQDNKSSGIQLNKDRQEDHKSTTSESWPRHNSNHYSGVSNRVKISVLPSRNDSNENTIYASHPVFLNSDSQDLKRSVADNDMLKLQVRNYQELNLRLEKENLFLKNLNKLEKVARDQERYYDKDTLEMKITEINEIHKSEIKETEEKCKKAEQVRIDEITQEHAEAHKKNLKTISSKYEDEIAKLKEQILVESLQLDNVKKQLFNVYKENHLLGEKINEDREEIEREVKQEYSIIFSEMVNIEKSRLETLFNEKLKKSKEDWLNETIPKIDEYMERTKKRLDEQYIINQNKDKILSFERQLKTMERLMSVEDEVQSLRRENQFLKEEAEQLKEVSHKLPKAEERAKFFESRYTGFRVILSIFMFLFIMFYC